MNQLIKYFIQLIAMLAVPCFAQGQEKDMSQIRLDETEKMTLVKGQEKDTLQILLGETEKIILVGDNIDVFEGIKLDSILSEVRTLYGGSFNNSGTERVTDTIFLEKSIMDKGKKAPQGRGNDDRGSLTLTIDAGVGLVRDMLSPVFSGGMLLKKARNNPDVFRGGFVEASPYFFFSKAEDGYRTDINLFLSAGVQLKRGTINCNIGAGALVMRQGSYFDLNTYKLFTGFSPLEKMFVTIMPELYITGVFKKVFPGLTLRVGF